MPLNKLEADANIDIESRITLNLDVEEAFKKDLNFIPEHLDASTFRRITDKLKNKIIDRANDIKAISKLVNYWIYKFDITGFEDTQNIINY